MPPEPVPNSSSTIVGKLVAAALLALLAGGPALPQTSAKFPGVHQSNRVEGGRVTARSSPSIEATLAEGATCDRALRFLVGVLGAHGPVEVHTDLSLGQIEDLASRVGHQGKHKPFGFYASAFNYTIGIDLPESAGGTCDRIIRIRVDLALTERWIEIGREVGDDRCLFSAVLDHYGQHAAFDDAALSRLVQWARTAFDHAPMPQLQGGPHSMEDDRERVREFAKKILEPGLPAFDAERNSAAETVDTPAEVQKLTEGCSTHA